MPAMSTKKRLELPEGAEVSAVALVVLVGALGRTDSGRSALPRG